MFAVTGKKIYLTILRERKQVKSALWVCMVLICCVIIWEPSVLDAVIFAFLPQPQAQPVVGTASGDPLISQPAPAPPLAKMVHVPFVFNDHKCDELFHKSGFNFTYSEEFWDHIDSYKSFLTEMGMLSDSYTDELTWVYHALSKMGSCQNGLWHRIWNRPQSLLLPSRSLWHQPPQLWGKPSQLHPRYGCVHYERVPPPVPVTLWGLENPDRKVLRREQQNKSVIWYCWTVPWLQKKWITCLTHCNILPIQNRTLWFSTPILSTQREVLSNHGRRLAGKEWFWKTSGAPYKQMRKIQWIDQMPQDFCWDTSLQCQSDDLILCWDTTHLHSTGYLSPYRLVLCKREAQATGLCHRPAAHMSIQCVANANSTFIHTRNPTTYGSRASVHTQKLFHFDLNSVMKLHILHVCVGGEELSCMAGM